jgi:hypothetical protein
LHHAVFRAACHRLPLAPRTLQRCKHSHSLSPCPALHSRCHVIYFSALGRAASEYKARRTSY